MEISEIASKLEMSEAAVRKQIYRGLRKLARAGEKENFAALVHQAQLKKAGPYIRCGSIECRPEKWTF